MSASALAAYLKKRLAEAFGLPFWGFFAVAAASAGLCYWLLGAHAFEEALARDTQLILAVIPRILPAVVIAGCVAVLLPREKIARHLGADSGFTGLALASLAGIVTPGGPVGAFSFAALLGGAGVDRGALVAFLTAWSTLGLQRILVWDVPLMGADFSLLRFAASLPLPLIAGWLARRIPIHPVFPGAAPLSPARPGDEAGR
ncbi:MAG: permease [Kiloniellales bacterium]